MGLRAAGASASTPTARSYIDGVPFTSARLQQTLRDAEAHARSSSPSAPVRKLEAEAQRLWQDEKPDEYFFLEVYGSAVVEHWSR